MKHLLLSALVLISVSAMGQKADSSLNLARFGTIALLDSTTVGKFYTGYIRFEQPQPPLDTIKILMLVCDTSPGYAPGVLANGGECDSLPFQNRSAYYQYGYSIREKHNEAEGVNDPGFYYGRTWNDYWVHLRYLDENRKPLHKNIVVWMAFTFKNNNQ